MSDLLSPFVTKKIACPICRTYTEQRFFRQRLFATDKRESDQHVLSYIWMNPKVLQDHPPHYFMFFCPSCYYADASTTFTKPYDSEFGGEVVRHLKNISSDEKIVLSTLAERVNYNNIDFESALYLHLIATYIHSRPAEEVMDTLKVGRFFLRIAWLYRENPEDTSSNGTKGATPEEKRRETEEQFALGFAADTRELAEKVSSIEQTWNEASQKIDLRLAALQSRLGEDHGYGYKAIQTRLTALLKHVNEELTHVRDVFTKDMEEAKARNNDTAENRSANLTSIRSFLSGVKKLWDEVPLNEQEAMRCAIRYFQRALIADPRLGSHDAYFNIVFLVADLFIRCNDYTGALSMVNSIYKSGADARKRYQQQLRESKLDDSERRRLVTRLQRVNSSIEQTGEFRRELIDRYIVKEKSHILTMIKKFSSVPPEKLEQTLIDNGIPRDVIHRLKEKGKILEHLASVKK